MNILVVEDNPATLTLFEKSLVAWGYTVYTAENGHEAWNCIEKNSVDIVVSDWVMPEVDGVELCQRIRSEETKEYVYFIFITSQDSKEDILNGLEAGADDYLIKPINIDELKARVEIGKRLVELERKAHRRYDEIKRNSYQTIRMFTSLIEVFDEDLGGHCRRTGTLSLDMAKRHPDVSESEYEIIESAGLLHDIGMIGLPNEILSKKRTERNDDERKHYLSHPERGQIILDEIEFLRPISKVVRAHHEQVNGRGFPDGLKDKEISVLAKIVSAASVYDNFIHRGKVPLEEIPTHLQQMKGFQLDPYIVDLLLNTNMERMKEESLKNYRAVGLDELKEGMVLARDIRMKTGALAMPCDMEMTLYGIEKLISFRKLECINDTIYVYKNV